MNKGFPLVVLLAGALLAGCSVSVPPATPQPSPARPRPVGVVEGPGAVPSPVAPGAVPQCDPRASLRPDGALPAPGAMPAGSTMRRIQDRGRLVVGVDQNAFLFGYRNPATGQLEGFDIEMLRAVASAILGDPDAITYKVITQAQRIPVVKSGEVDIVADTMTITCGRLQEVTFSTVYYEDGQKVMVLKGSGIKGPDDLGGKRACASKGTTSIAEFQKLPAKPVTVGVDNWTDCLVMLQQGQVDAISTDGGILAGMVAQDPNTEIVGRAFTEEPYGLAIAKENPDLVRFVNAVLEKTKANGEWAASYRRWLEPRMGPQAPPPAKYLP
ncbi:ABC transporter substrate-binding protein [Longispora fulva]|uniref:Polar amino acid transport system substrate-binding protein n=1 Tax=Longispora fulva TaxID=619741 RepID=A0A8J7GCT2_9ACTN|nr:glutamate ABC transporter substrate-binding protein [Longispora fulva]MBG6135266.1 polar amino acid transport system substrate-binding protein [Longispora fulva]GIG56495.1 ABC transporter substrate-binding protein [Longispora fulva]